MNLDRMMVARAVYAGQLGPEHITNEELLEINLNMMTMIGERKMEEGKTVFADHDTLQ